MYSAQGIILKREDFREKDEKVFLYTKEFGKILVVAKGTKRIEAKLRGSLDILNFVDIIFVEGRYFFILTNIDIREGFKNIVNSSYAYSAALSISHALLHIFEDNLPARLAEAPAQRAGQAGARDEEFFTFLYAAMKKLNELDQKSSLYPWLLLKKFQIKILENQGYKVDDNILSSLNMPRPSPSVAAFLKMIQGPARLDIRLSKHDFIGIEGVIGEIFSYIFNYRISTWIPMI